VDQDVLRLEILVDDLLVMERGERLGDTVALTSTIPRRGRAAPMAAPVRAPARNTTR
jgi:hypothetical protein